MVETNLRQNGVSPIVGGVNLIVWSVVLFSAMFSCFILDSFKLLEMVFLIKHGATFSSRNISRRTLCPGYDEHACTHKDKLSQC